MARRTCLTSLSGGIISFVPGFSRARGRPIILPMGIPGLLIGNTRNVTINVTASVPPRGFKRIVSNIVTCVGGPSVAATRVVRCVPKPSFPAKKVVTGGSSLPTVCRSKINGVGVHKGVRVRGNGNNGSHVMVARVPCAVVKTGVKGFLGSICNLMRSGTADSVASVAGRSSGRKVHVILRLGGKTSVRTLRGLLCGGAGLRSAFNIGVLTMTSNEPRAVNIIPVVHRRIGFRCRVTAEGCRALLTGRRSGGRVRRNLVHTYGIVSLVVRVLHNDHDVGSTGTYLASKGASRVAFGGPSSGVVTRRLGFASHRTRTVLRVHLCGLVNLRVRTLVGRRSRALRGVTGCRSVLRRHSSVTGMVVGRLATFGGTCNGRHGAIVSGLGRTMITTGGVRRRSIIFLVSHFKCTGVISASICREGGRTTGTRCERVFAYGGASGVYVFASGKRVRLLGILSLPCKGFQSGKAPVSGLYGCSDGRRGIMCLTNLRRIDSRQVLFNAGCTVVGIISNVRFIITGGAATTAGLKRRSRMLAMYPLRRGSALIVTAGGSVFLQVSYTRVPRGGGNTINIHNVGLTTKSRLGDVRILRRNRRGRIRIGKGPITLRHLRIKGHSAGKMGGW